MQYLSNIHFFLVSFDQMAYLIFLLALCILLPDSWFQVSIALSDLTCSDGQTYVKFIKNNGDSFADEEVFEVYDGSTLLYTSPQFANNEVRTIEQCLTSTTNHQYILKMTDGYGDSWDSGSFLTIYGQYGNVVFKNMLTDSDEETHQFSL